MYVCNDEIGDFFVMIDFVMMMSVCGFFD